MSNPTHVDIPEDLKKAAKIKAVELGVSFRQYLIDALTDKNKGKVKK